MSIITNIINNTNINNKYNYYIIIKSISINFTHINFIISKYC